MTTADTTIIKKQKQHKKETSIVHMFLAGALGSSVALIASLTVGNGDALQNVVDKIQVLFQVTEHAKLYITFMLMFFIVIMGGLVCWVYEPQNRADAFIKGCSTLALLSLTPNRPHDNQIPISSEKSASTWNQLAENPEQNIYASNAAAYFEQDQLVSFASWRPWQQDFRPNATVLYNEWISTCKPSTGAASYILNTINICKSDDKLNRDERIEMLGAYFDTSVRGYRYHQVKYVRNNEVKTGWICSGRKPDYYANILRDRQIVRH
jgi:hypothetical protein